MRRARDIGAAVLKVSPVNDALVGGEEVKMLDAYIIEQIRKRDEERRRIYERPALELPLEPIPQLDDDEPEAEEAPEPRRVIIIDL